VTRDVPVPTPTDATEDRAERAGGRSRAFPAMRRKTKKKKKKKKKREIERRAPVLSSSHPHFCHFFCS